MFFGSCYRNLDEKGRLAVPASFKVNPSTKLYLLKGFEGCLSIYNQETFIELTNKLSKLSFTSKDARDYVRISLGSVVELEVDKASRILIPKDVVGKYKIKKTVMVLGVLDHFEIWDSKHYEEYYKAADKDFENIAEKLNTHE